MPELQKHKMYNMNIIYIFYYISLLIYMMVFAMLYNSNSYALKKLLMSW